MQRTHVTVCAVCSACVTITEGFHPSHSILFYSIVLKHCFFISPLQDPHAEEFEDKEWTFVIENVSTILCFL